MVASASTAPGGLSDGVGMRELALESVLGPSLVEMYKPCVF